MAWQHRLNINRTEGAYDMLFTSRTAGIGLDIEDNRVRMAVLNAHKSGFRLESYGEKAIPAQTVENGRINQPDILAEVLRELWSSLKTGESNVVTAIPSQHVFVRNLTMPAMKPRDIFRAARYHFLSVLPLPLEETVVQVTGIRYRETGDLEVTLVAVRRSQVEELTSVITLAGLKPVVAEIRPLAARRVLGIDTTPQVLVDICNQVTHLSYFDKGHLRFTRTLFTGEPGNQDVRLSAGDGGYPNASDLVFEIKRSLDYWSRESTSRIDPQKLVMIGTRADEDFLTQNFDQPWSINFECGDPWRTVQRPHYLTPPEKHELERRFIIALGLAARGRKSR